MIKAREMVYKEVVQVVLLYGRKIWVVTDAMMTVLEGFNHRFVRRTMGMTVKKGYSREW